MGGSSGVGAARTLALAVCLAALPLVAGCGGLLVVENQTPDAVLFLRVQAADADWSDDQLGEGNLLHSGDSVTLSLAEGVYWVRAEFSGNAWESPVPVWVGEGDTSYLAIPADAVQGLLTIQNDSQKATITAVRWSLTSESAWSGEQLGGQPIPCGGKRSWRLPRGSYHLRLELSNGNTIDDRKEWPLAPGGEQVCTVFDVAPTTGELELVNESRHAVYRVLFAPQGEPGWGPDRLGDDEKIASGARKRWTFPPGAYRLKVQLETGDEVIASSEQTIVAGQVTSVRVFDE